MENNQEFITAPDKNRAMEEDLKLDVQTDYIVDLHLKKPGLDIENGKYKILGAVTDKNIYKRPKKTDKPIETTKVKGNIVPSIGYKVLEVATGKTKLITKKQGIELCRLYGMTNAYITCKNFEKKDENGQVIKSNPLVYLQPYPAQTEAFTQDNRIVSIFELDANCKYVVPIKLQVTEEEATPEMWEIIQISYQHRLAQSKKSNKGNTVRYEHQTLMENLRAELRKESNTISHENIFKL